MQTQITITGDMKAISALLARMAGGTLPATVVSDEALATTDAPRRRGRPSKAEVEARTADIEVDTDGDEFSAEEGGPDDDEPAEEETEEVDELEEEKPAKVAKAPAATKLTQGDMVKAFQAYAKKYTREKAGLVLRKLKVKSVAEIPAAKYPEVLKMLKG